MPHYITTIQKNSWQSIYNKLKLPLLNNSSQQHHHATIPPNQPSLKLLSIVHSLYSPYHIIIIMDSDVLPLGPPASLPPLDPGVLSNLLAASPYPAQSISCISATEAFNTGLAARDHMLCVVCGYSLSGCVVNCHIIPKNGINSAETWDWLKEQNAIPERAKSHQHECRNGLMMCLNHHQSFNNLHWFVR